MKSFTILCFIFLFSAFVFAARAEEENETPKEEEQHAAEVNDEQEPETTEENDEEETENNEAEAEDESETEEDEEEEDVEKRSGYGHGHGHFKVICPKKCWKVCRANICTRRVCKQYQCGNRKVCHRVTRYRTVKKPYKINVGDYYYPRYVVKYRTSKVAYYGKVCKKVAKYCTRCWVQKYKCGKKCRTVCKKQKCYSTKGGYGH